MTTVVPAGKSACNCLAQDGEASTYLYKAEQKRKEGSKPAIDRGKMKSMCLAANIKIESRGLIDESLPYKCSISFMTSM